MLLGIQIVNINGLEMTKNVVDDLMKQTHQFNLTIVDQGSREEGTKEYLQSLRSIPFINIEIIQNDHNVDLNRLWNRFYDSSREDYLCFLNNDIRLPENFVEDTINVFSREKDVGAVVHATNHPDYQSKTTLRYAIMEGVTQGWDFTMRKSVYTRIPDVLRVFGGDDWLFTQMYKKMMKTAVCLSSPIIHYHAKSRKFYTGDRREEDKELREHLKVERLSYVGRYNKTLPQFDKMIEGEGYVKKGAWYE